MIARGRILYLALFILAVPEILWAAGAGSSGGAILNMPVGARAIGMGEAFTAQADDVSSLYWNPAGIALLNQSQAAFMYNRFFNDFTYQNAAVAVPMENGGLGASLSYLSYGDIKAVDAAGNRTGDVNAYSGVATFGGAWLGNNWSAGFNVKGIQEALADVKANGFAADMGATLIYPNEVKGGTLRGAAAVRNVGPGLKFIDQTDPLPTQWRVGVAAVEMMKRKLNLSLDYGKERDANGAVYAGAEYLVIPHVALRAGYAGSDTEGSGLRAGIGFKFKDFSFDYAYSHYGDLGFSHRYELSMRFGGVHSRLTPEERKLLRRAKLAMAEKRFGEATELLDALIQMEPEYRPVRRLIKTAMRGYETQDRSASAHFTTLKTVKPRQNDDVDEARDIEKLLSMSDEALAQSPNSAVKEKQP